MQSECGDAGATPFRKWERGLVCTVRPLTGDFLEQSQDYIVCAVSRRRQSGVPVDSYADLYERASTIVHARARELGLGKRLAARNILRGWGTAQFGAGRSMAFGSLMIGLRAEVAGQETPAREAELPPAAFSTAYTKELDALQEQAARRFNELYVDFDFRSNETACRSCWICSYGEYAANIEEDVDFKPFVHRAQQRADFYQAALNGFDADERIAEVYRREWNALRNIGRTTAPNNLIDVTLYFG